MSLDKWLEQAKKDGIVKEEKEGSNPSRKQAIDILPEAFEQRPGFKNPKGTVEQRFTDMFPEVKQWLRYKPKGTAKRWAFLLWQFCKETNMLPSQFIELNRDKEERKKARDIAWDVICKTKDRTSGLNARQMLSALQSFYSYHNDGDKLPFVTQKGGHHYIRQEYKDKRQKYGWGTLEQAREAVFTIINEASNLRDRTLFTIAIVTGMRRNAFETLKWKHLKNVITVDGKEVLVIRVTPEIDHKIESYGFEYYAFLSGHALRLLRRYEEKYRRNQIDEDFVFNTKVGPMRGDTITRAWSRTVKRAERKGLIPEGTHKKLWFHRLRALFRKFVRNSQITDDEFKEFIMGHVLKGSREAYAERDPSELAKEYLKVDFQPPIAYLKEQLRKTIEEKEKLEVEPTEGKEPMRERLEERLDEETVGWQTPKIEDQTLPYKGPLPQARQPKETVTMTKTLTVQKVREGMKPTLERILKPAPKHCFRGKTFGPNDTDQYCHEVCAKQDPNAYQACQEMQQEEPHLFA